jgi:Putative transposase
VENAIIVDVEPTRAIRQAEVLAAKRMIERTVRHLFLGRASSAKHRRASKDWLANREADLLPVPYYHLVFTLPAPIADIACQNKAVLCDLLFKVSAETMLTIAAEPRHLGARIGITSVLHTWGSALTHHPHVHMIVPGGGISPDGQRWVSCRPGFFLPVRVLSRLFRRLFLQKLIAAHQAGRLSSFGSYVHLAEAQSFAAYLAPLRKAEWSSTQSARLAALRRCWPIRRATPTASPSPTAA